MAPRLRNVLAYPGGLPRFDPSHPAATGTLFSGVPFGGRFINLLTALPLNTVSGTAATAGVDGNLGPVAKFAANGAQSSSTLFAATTPSFTLAAFFRPAAVSGTTIVVGLNNNTGLGQVSGVLVLRASSSNSSSGLTVSVGVPYFAAASWLSGGNINFVLVNLNTGNIQTATSSTAATINLSVFLIAAAGTAANDEFNGSIGPVLLGINNYLSLPLLTNWAQSPWDFWFPSNVQNLIFAGLGTSVTADTFANHGYLLMM